jgi:hypothetical protein
VLNTSTGSSASALVESVDWAQCTGDKYPGGDYYGLKDFPEYSFTGQGSYLAGAISEAQYELDQAYQAAPTRMIGNTAYPVTKAIIILSDGEFNSIPKRGSSDGVDPGAAGDITETSNTPCEDAIEAANAAKEDNTTIFSIAYDDSGGNCEDSGSGTGSSSCTGTNTGTNTYSGSGPYDGSACALMEYIASPGFFADQSDSGGLNSDFEEAGNELTGDSALIADCTQAAPC